MKIESINIKHQCRLHHIVLWCTMYDCVLLYHFKRIAPIKAQRTSLSCLSLKLRCQLEVPGADGQVETLNWEVPEWWDVRCAMCNVREVSKIDDLEMLKSTFQIVEHGRSVTTRTFSEFCMWMKRSTIWAFQRHHEGCITCAWNCTIGWSTTWRTFYWRNHRVQIESKWKKNGVEV